MTKIRLVFGLLLCFGWVQAQDDAAEKAQKEAEKALRASTNLTYEANQELTANDFVGAESEYRRAISKSDKNAAAPFNLGNAYYNRESYGEAFGRYKQAGDAAEDKAEKHKAFHNMGNVFMKNKEYEKAVEAYKEALRNNPDDEETRYNLALAKKMLEKQQDEQKNDQDQNKDNQDKQDQKDKNQDKQDQKNEGGDNDKQDEGKQNEDENKDKGDQGENGEDKPEENQKGDGDQKKEQEKKPNEGDQPQDQKQQPRPNQLSKQQIQNLLEAMQNEEKKVQEKMEARKVRGQKVKNEKDW
ncbi:tetratricopeptide repeat protein [Flagellimonas aequoris]|uniref:Tetratricopeptide repeat protein n=1 Tax=Flagellimonas aequoris TaxID=2306997 RepID=A0A418N7F7_9FLAO|nr:tetratricopeptide repeat protein [Allomuricauda aequoris]RIV70852.1 tetratricopeptide repeat protein [Allomuricauda aequoris]TXK02343.1 tetratricopeptide repeat protein [Allomuricauda aequoris]